MSNFSELHRQYLENTKQYPAILKWLADHLGVSTDSLDRLQVGFYPGKQAFVISERDAKGNITGLSYRNIQNKKWCHEGSTRGLIYVPGQNSEYTPGPENWTITTKELPCPLCNKAGECKVSKNNPANPAAIMCAHVEQGATKRLDNCWLHVRRHNAGLGSGPILITEGFSDTAFAITLGYTAVGVPSAGSCIELLKPLVKNHKIIIVADTDPVGRIGAEKIGKLLKRHCLSVKIIAPPTEFDDLRHWHPTRDFFDAWLETHGKAPDVELVIGQVVPMQLAERFIQANFQSGEDRLLHYHQSEFWEWTDSHYQRQSQTWLNSRLFDFFGQFEIEKKGKDAGLQPLIVNNYLLKDLTTALQSACYLDIPEDVSEPFHIKTRHNVDLEYAVAFRNGILNLRTDKIQPLTPDIFLTSVFPFDYNPKAQCPNWEWFVRNIFNEDQQSIDLLQEWCGYLLVPSNRFQAMMFFYGGKAAGKSTTIAILQRVLHGRYFSIDLESFISEFGLQSLVGKFALFVDEDRPIRKADSARIVNRIKKISGGDMLEIRRKYREAINIKPSFRITYSANLLPPLSDISGALMRRVNLLYFPNNYSANPDRSLEEKLAPEIPGMAVWCIAGLQRLLKKGDFTVPEISKAYLWEYQQLTNPLQKLLDEHCEIVDPNTNPDVWATSRQMYDLVNIFFAEQGEEKISNSQLGLQLMSLLGSNRKTRISRGSGKSRQRFYAYLGIRILPSGQELLMQAE